MDVLNVLAFLSYLAINVDIVLQIRRLRITKSSHDVSLVGCTVRYVAILIIFIKFYTLGDIYLLLGQVLAVITFGTYLWFVVLYAKNGKGRSKTKRMLP